jgi:hypothetical protein
MKRLIPVVALAAALFAPSGAAAQSPDREVMLEQTSYTTTWEGAKASGAGVLYQPQAYSCTKQDPYYCDVTLVSVTAGPTPLTVETIKQKGQDFDLYVYASNADGVPMQSVGASLEEGDVAEKVVVDGASGYYLVAIHYWAVENAAAMGKATLTKFAPPPSTQPPASEPPSTNPPATTPPATTPPGTTPPGTAPAAFDFSIGFGKAKIKAGLSKGFPISLSCSAACKGTVQVSIDAKTAKKYKLGKKAMVVGKLSFDKAAGKHALAIKLSSKAKKRLAKAKALKLSLTATATSGSTTKTVTAKGSFKK